MMTERNRLSRRDLLRLSGVGGLLWAADRTPAGAQTLRRTPTQVLGPFYPVVKPLDQDADLTGLRAPHIHFEVFGRTNRLVTQMYFAGEALNDTDRFLGTAAGNRERLIVPFKPSPESQATGSLVGLWDIVLDQG